MRAACCLSYSALTPIISNPLYTPVSSPSMSDPWHTLVILASISSLQSISDVVPFTEWSYTIHDTEISQCCLPLVHIFVDELELKFLFQHAFTLPLTSPFKLHMFSHHYKNIDTRRAIRKTTGKRATSGHLH